MSEFAQSSPSLRVEWDFGPDAPVGIDRLLALLAAIETSGSIAGAARATGLSYRNAWGLINAWQAWFGQPLIATARAHGSTLEAFARQLLEIDRGARQSLARALDGASQPMRALSLRTAEQGGAALRFAASHEPLLNDLIRQLRSERADAAAVTLSTHGSLESLLALAARRCEIAGFHCPEGPAGASLWQQYKPHLRPRQQVLIRLTKRSQGILVAPGNPKKLRGIRDLARPGVRFLNRQSGAGTRLLLDWLLRQNDIAASAIAGYGDVEMTHSAVAAMIASGHADAGLGVEAAARQFNLGFVPLLKEDYFLVTRRERQRQPAFAALLDLLGGNAFRRAVRALPGYDPTGSGTEAPFYRD